MLEKKFQLVKADRPFRERIELYMRSYGLTDISDWQLGDSVYMLEIKMG